MALSLVCEEIKKTADKLLVKTNPPIDINRSIRATGQMLVDSKQLAFLYILDDEKEYKYVVFHEHTWSLLKRHLSESLPVFISSDSGEIELNAFYAELTYLLSNIKDNPNYGEKMNEVVERIFF